MSEWQEVRLSDVSDIIAGYAFKGKDFSDDGDELVIKIKDIQEPFVDTNDATKVFFKNYSKVKLEKFLVKKGDFVIAMTGATIGKIGRYVGSGYAYINQRVAKFEAKNGTDKDFLYFVTQHQNFKTHILNNIDSQSAQGNISATSIGRYSFYFPSLPEQKGIAQILKSIDQKIELNQRMNETLEGMARAIFKSWFVDFDPVHAKAAGRTPEGMGAATAELFPKRFTDDGLPYGWTQESVISSAEYINGAAYKNMHFSDEPDSWPVVKIAELKSGISPQTKFTNSDLGDKYKLDTGDILFSWSGSPDTSIDTFIWTGGKGWLNQHIFKVVNKNRAERCFAYWLLKYLKPEFIEVARNKQTTGLGHVTRKDMEWMQYCKPDLPVLDLFYETVGLLLDQIENNLIQNQTLAALRDTLLPKLISGELRLDIPSTDPLKEAV